MVVNLLVHEILDVPEPPEFDAMGVTNSRDGFFFSILVRRMILGHPYSRNLGAIRVGGVVLDYAIQNTVKGAYADGKSAAQILQVSLEVPQSLCDELCTEMAALPALGEMISGGGVRARLAMLDEARNFDLVGWEDVNGQQVGKVMVSVGQLVQDGVVGGSEVSPHEIDQDASTRHDDGDDAGCEQDRCGRGKRRWI